MKPRIDDFSPPEEKCIGCKVNALGGFAPAGVHTCKVSEYYKSAPTTPEEECDAIWHGKSCSERRFCSVCGKGYRRNRSKPVGNWEEEFERIMRSNQHRGWMAGFPYSKLKAFIKEVAASEYRRGFEHAASQIGPKNTLHFSD